MSAPLKCPNPGCPFLFDPSKVPPGSMLTCPRCAYRFTLGSGPMPSSAMKQSPPIEALEEVRPKVLSSKPMILFGVLAVFLVAVAAVVLIVLPKETAEQRDSSRTELSERNLSLKSPEGWEDDDKARKSAMCDVAGFKKPDSTARMALGVVWSESGRWGPGAIDALIRQERLGAMFKDLEMQTTDAEWMGRPARRTAFRGRDAEGAIIVGEGWACLDGPRIHLFLAWAKASDLPSEVKAEMEAFRNECRLLKVEPPRPLEEKVFEGKAANYRVIDREKLWKLDPVPGSEDESADLLFNAETPIPGRGDQTSKATVVVLILPGAGDPIARLKKHVDDRYAKLFEVKKWAELTDAPQGDGSANLDLAGIKRFAADSSNPNGSKFVVLKAIRVGNKIIGLEAYCDLKERAIWEKRLIAIANGLREP